MEVEENATIGAGLLPSVRHYENPRRHRRAISDITHHPSVSVSVPMFPHLPSCCQHHQQQQKQQQQQLTWGHAQVPTGRKSPSRFIVSLQRPAPVAVACSQPSLWCQQPGRTLNEPMSHQPGISQESASNQQPATSEQAINQASQHYSRTKDPVHRVHPSSRTHSGQGRQTYPLP